MKACNFCGNKNFREKHVQYIYKHNDRFLVVNNVPCEECEYCGEQYFKAEALRKIEEDFNAIHVSSKRAKRETTVPIEEFAEI
ncbi:MAG: YgiT-type zinc finger protein [Thermodesulfovibrionales bacterium]|nr:YgiT-type zinc finger protein [Thermodesulfovibrionales bacterium]